MVPHMRGIGSEVKVTVSVAELVLMVGAHTWWDLCFPYSHLLLIHRKMWQALGEMSKEEVQKRFAQLMDSSSEHSFLAWVGQKVKEEEEERRWDMTLSGSTLFWFTLCL